MKEMVGGCCVCSDERGWAENPLVYCDGQGCTVAVHQACYGIVQVPTGPWFCRKCESQERCARVRCELCPSRDGALKRTDNGGWAHVVCAFWFRRTASARVASSASSTTKRARRPWGACMQCNKSGCKQYFHVTCAQAAGLLCEEAGNYMDNVKYCGYCPYHYQKVVSAKRDNNIKIIPAFKPIPAECDSREGSPERKPARARMKGGQQYERGAAWMQPAAVQWPGVLRWWRQQRCHRATKWGHVWGGRRPRQARAHPVLHCLSYQANSRQPTSRRQRWCRRAARCLGSGSASGAKTEPLSPPPSSLSSSNPTPSFSSIYENLVGSSRHGEKRPKAKRPSPSQGGQQQVRLHVSLPAVVLACYRPP
ncbi:hypothetical protein MTO96_015519 [Rhipicephalus appendiculatus]